MRPWGKKRKIHSEFAYTGCVAFSIQHDDFLIIATSMFTLTNKNIQNGFAPIKCIIWRSQNSIYQGVAQETFLYVSLKNRLIHIKELTSKGGSQPLFEL